MKKGILIIIIALVVVTLAVGAYFMFWHKSSVSSGTPMIPASNSGSSSSNSAPNISGLSLNAGSAQTDTTPTETTNIPPLS